jgi:hypothetical protein
MRKVLTGFLIAIVCFLLLGAIGVSSFFNCTATGKRIWNNYWHDVQQADDNTRYENRKEVEDTCRSMISSYNADKLTYMQYKDSEVELERSWAESAKMRANQTASTYNNYILKNNYIFEENVPSDIYMTLPYLD